MAVSIIILGAQGRMGNMLCTLAKADPDLNLAGVVDRPGHEQGLERWGCLTDTNLEAVLKKTPMAVVIDFTAPEASVATAETIAKHGNPAVIGTTGLSVEQLDRVRGAAAKTPILWAPNMSVGVNVLLQILPKLVTLLGEKFDMEMMEVHHKAKKDAPSGTAVKLAQVMTEARSWKYDTVKCCGREGMVGARPQEEMGVMALRGGDVVGDHTMYFFGPGERIEVKHQAHSRETFAQGALRAAKWLAGQKAGRLYSMADVLA